MKDKIKAINPDAKNPGATHLEIWQAMYNKNKDYRFVEGRRLNNKQKDRQIVEQGDFFKSVLDRFTDPDGEVLDLGCGWGRWNPMLSERFSYNGIDILAELIEVAKSKHENGNFQVYHPDGVFPIVDNSIDVVWTCTMIQHVTEPAMLQKLFSEMDRVLRPGGKVVSFENIWFKYRKKNRPVIHFRSEEMYQELFGKIGTVEMVGILKKVMCGMFITTKPI